MRKERRERKSSEKGRNKRERKCRRKKERREGVKVRKRRWRQSKQKEEGGGAATTSCLLHCPALLAVPEADVFVLWPWAVGPFEKRRGWP